MDLFIGIADFAPYRSISVNINQQKELEPWIGEAQRMDIQPVLGEELWLDLIEDRYASDEYEKLAIDFIVPALCYYAYSRYIRNANDTSTPYGLHVKTNPYSTPTSDQAIARKSGDALNCAMVYMQDAIDYICKNPDAFTKYKNSKHESKRKGGFRVSKIGR